MNTLPFTIDVNIKQFTPRIFDELVKHPYCFFLDSAEHNERKGRYSYFGVDPVRIYSSIGAFITIDNKTFIDNPVESLRRFESTVATLPHDPYLPFHGGLVGYVGHSWPYTAKPNREEWINLPDAWFGLYDTVLIFDHLEQLCTISSMGLTPNGESDKEIAERKCEELLGQLCTKPEEKKPSYVLKPTLPEPVSSFTEDLYVNAVGSAKNKLAKKEWKRINIAQRFHSPVAVDSWSIHKLICGGNPTPYASFLRCGSFEILSASPSGFLRIDEKKIACNVVQKSVSREVNHTADEIKKVELLHNSSEVDPVVEGDESSLSIILNSKPEVEPAHLESDTRSHYLINQISGLRVAGSCATDCLVAALPGASMTGVPKLTVNDWLRRTEPALRHTYTGVIGYIGTGEKAQFSLAVRTMIVKDQIAYIHSGRQLDETTEAEEAYFVSKKQIGQLFEDIKGLGYPRHP